MVFVCCFVIIVSKLIFGAIMNLFVVILCLVLSFSKNPTIQGFIPTEKLSPVEFAPKEGQCRIFLLRHAETEWNVISKPQGWNDIPLNEIGKMQAQTLGSCFSELAISAIYASPLSRAKETAQAVASYHSHCEVVFDPALRFYDPDEKKKKSEAEIAAEITEQATVYLERLAEKHRGKNIVVITHGKVIKHLLVSLGGYDLNKIKVSNAAVVEVLADVEGLRLGTSLKTQDSVGHQHGDRHGADATGNGRDRRG